MVDGEGHAIQGLGAHHAAEAAGVVRVPESLQDLRTQKDIQISGVFTWLFLLWVFFWHKYGNSLFKLITTGI